MSNLVASLKIVAQNGASRVFGQIASDARRMGSAFRPVAREAASADRAIAGVGTGAAQRFGAIRASLRRLNDGGFKLAEKGAYGLGRGIGSALRSAGKLAFTWGAIGAGAGAAGVGAFGLGIIKTASDFEQFQVILENTEGSAVKARKSMDWVKQFAKTTPYEVANVMEAYVQLRAYGIDPMEGSLKSLGNAASGMNKDLMQAVEMLADAQTGEFERLKEFGIRAKVSGSSVAFTYMQAGKEVTRTAKNSARDIQKSILGIFDAKFAGMMDRQSRTLKGTWSNIKDMFAGFQLDVADAGIFDLIKQKANSLLTTAQRLAKDGTLKRWANDVSDGLESAVNWAASFTEEDWKTSINDIKEVASGVWDLVKALSAAGAWVGSLFRGLSEWKQEVALKQNQGIVDGWFTSPQAKREAQARIDAYYRRQMNGGGNSAGPGTRVDVPWATGPTIKRGKGGPPLMPRLQGANPLSARPQPPVKVGGALDIKITTDPGMRATTTRLSSANSNVPINVGNRGAVSFG